MDINANEDQMQELEPLSSDPQSAPEPEEAEPVEESVQEDGTAAAEEEGEVQAEETEPSLEKEAVEFLEELPAIEEVEEPEEEAKVEFYEIVSGDTLGGIAKKYYGSAGKYMKIFEANRDIIDDPQIGIAPVNVFFDPSPVSASESETFRLLEETILETAPVEDVIVSPFLVPGATDSRFFIPSSLTTKN